MSKLLVRTWLPAVSDELANSTLQLVTTYAVIFENYSATFFSCAVELEASLCIFPYLFGLLEGGGAIFAYMRRQIAIARKILAA